MARAVEHVLVREGYAVQRPRRLAARKRRIGSRRPLQSSIRLQGNEAVEHRLEPFGAGDRGGHDLDG